MFRSSHGRSPRALDKLTRINDALRHREPDRVPLSDFFGGGFIRRWRKELNLADDADPYEYYDLDWVVTIPNMDPHIRPFEILREDAQEVVVKTGFETVLRQHYDMPMPEQVNWDIDTLERLEDLEFDDPYDSRRFFWGGDNQIAGVGDSLTRELPPWIDTVRKLREKFVVYGSMIESTECLNRLVGPLNTLQWISEEPDRFGEQLLRINDFYYHCLKAEIEAAPGLLDGIVIWGDVADCKALFFAPDYWREYCKPTVRLMIHLCHQYGLPVIYRGCGNVQAILPDFIEIGLDAHNPLEAKAGLDAVELRRRYGHNLAFCGNSDILVCEEGNREKIRREVLRKLNAAKGGGLIFQSDHSVTSAVSGHTYDYIVKLVRQYGTYPLQLDEFDEKLDG